MKKISRKILSLVLSIIFLCGLNTTAFASENNSISDQTPVVVTNDMAIEMAERFAQTANPDKTLSAGNPIKFYDESGQAIGYIVNYYTDDNAQSGYVIFDNTSDPIVSEYTFDENALNPYENIVNNIGITVFRSSNAVKLYKTAPFTYGIVEESTGFITDNYGNETPVLSVLSLNDSEDKNPVDWEDVIMDVSDVYEDYYLVKSNNVDAFISYEEAYVESITGHYACAVSALLNCADYYGALDYEDLAGEYMDIWNLTNTTKDNESKGVIYGKTNIYNIGPGFVKYCSERGISISQSTVENPAYSFFTSCIDRGDMAVVHCGIIGDSTGARVGHSMSVSGYTTLISYDTGKTLHTLMISDGWNSYVRYLNFDFENWTEIRGTSFRG